MNLFRLVQQNQSGGWRAGAGAKAGDKGMVPHRTRKELKSWWVMHVNWHVVDEYPSLWNRGTGDVLRVCISKAKDRFGVRIIEFSAPNDHIHLVLEAESKKALSKALQGIGIRLAKNLNKYFKRSGKVFRDRYHVVAKKSMREVHNLLGYVLGNARKHGLFIPKGQVDPFGSACWFTGWLRFKYLPQSNSPVAAASNWMLRNAVSKYGKLDPDRVPGRK